MSHKVLWVGGIHGVGKTTLLTNIAYKNPDRISYIYLGRLFYESAVQNGKKWNELAEESNLIQIEEKVTEHLFGKLKLSDIVIDSHFCIYFGEKIFPGFHIENLRKIIHQTDKAGLINLIASPEVIIDRRKKSKKEYINYISVDDIPTIKKELSESEKYFDKFRESFDSNSVIKIIDTSERKIESLEKEVMEFYNES